MNNQIHFNKTDKVETLIPFKKSWRNTLTAPQDGMWDTFIEYAQHWEIKCDNKQIGYACINEQNQLLQFFLQAYWQKENASILAQFIERKGIESAVVGTNNPYFLSAVMHRQKSVKLHTYLFESFMDSELNKVPGRLNVAWEKDLPRLVKFYHLSVGAPEEWLSGYLSNLIDRGETFVFEHEGEILGTCEVRNSDTDPNVSDIGMVVSSHHRRKGIGSFLLGKAKQLAYDVNRTPICSCEVDNIGSLKSIHKNGFRSVHQILEIQF